jgi:hypothetical protein
MEKFEIPRWLIGYTLGNCIGELHSPIVLQLLDMSWYIWLIDMCVWNGGFTLNSWLEPWGQSWLTSGWNGGFPIIFKHSQISIGWFL